MLERLNNDVYSTQWVDLNTKYVHRAQGVKRPAIYCKQQSVWSMKFNLQLARLLKEYLL